MQDKKEWIEVQGRFWVIDETKNAYLIMFNHEFRNKNTKSYEDLKFGIAKDKIKLKEHSKYLLNTLLVHHSFVCALFYKENKILLELSVDELNLLLKKYRPLFRGIINDDELFCWEFDERKDSLVPFKKILEDLKIPPKKAKQLS